jgi:hypothetical protein
MIAMLLDNAVPPRIRRPELWLACLAMVVLLLGSGPATASTTFR